MPSQESLEQLVAAIRRGNATYDLKFPDTFPFLSVYDGLDLTVDLGVRRLQHGDIGFRSFSDVAGKFQVLHRHCQTENRLLAGVYVPTPLSVMISLSTSGHVVIFDSHAHDTDGAVLAVVQTACDWATLAAYLELTADQ